MEVTGNMLRVGTLVDPLDEIDSDAVARIAQTLQAELDTVQGDPHKLFAMLEEGIFIWSWDAFRQIRPSPPMLGLRLRLERLPSAKKPKTGCWPSARAKTGFSWRSIVQSMRIRNEA